MEKKSNKIIQVVAGLVVVAIVAFYGGMKYGQGSAATATTGQGRGQFGQGRGGRNGGGVTAGQILNQDANSITVQLRTGGSIIVFLSGSTQVAKTVDGSSKDLTTGEQVVVNGTANPDGSITAQSIQIRPALTPQK